MADIKKRMASVRARYFLTERYSPVEARYIARAIEQMYGDEATRGLHKLFDKDLVDVFQTRVRIRTHPSKDTPELNRAKEYFGADDDYTLARIMAEVLFGDDRRRRGRGVSLYEIHCARALMLAEDPKIRGDAEVARRLQKAGGIYKNYDTDTLRQLVREARLEFGHSVSLGRPRKY